MLLQIQSASDIFILDKTNQETDCGKRNIKSTNRLTFPRWRLLKNLTDKEGISFNFLRPFCTYFSAREKRNRIFFHSYIGSHHRRPLNINEDPKKRKKEKNLIHVFLSRHYLRHDNFCQSLSSVREKSAAYLRLEMMMMMSELREIFWAYHILK